MMGPIETLGWMVGAIIKFVLTPTLMMVRGATWWMTILVTSIGAAIGVLIFFHFGKWVFKVWGKWVIRKDKKRKAFTPARRRWVRFQKRFGLWGLLAISGLISVPIASILAAKYHSKDPRMPWLLVFAFVVWSFILTTLSLLLGETNPPQ
jgi:dipeptide/tripeptide permease